MGCVPSKPSNSFYSSDIRFKPTSPQSAQLQRNREERPREVKTGLDSYMKDYHAELGRRHSDAYNKLTSQSQSQNDAGAMVASRANRIEEKDGTLWFY